MGQMLLIPDPKPLDERLGQEFFREAPKRPGVYLMRDAGDNVLYVGKAKNLQRRLRSYRIANPDRMPRRQLRMLRQVARIELRFCPGESAALKRESELLRSLKPRFNRAGVWPGKTRFIVWRFVQEHLELTVRELPSPDWRRFGPLGGSAQPLHRALSCLLWLAFNPDRAIANIPMGWLSGKFPGAATIRCGPGAPEASAGLDEFFYETSDNFVLWLRSRLCDRVHPFERVIIESALQDLTELSSRRAAPPGHGQQMALL